MISDELTARIHKIKFELKQQTIFYKINDQYIYHSQSHYYYCFLKIIGSKPIYLCVQPTHEMKNQGPLTTLYKPTKLKVAFVFLLILNKTFVLNNA